MFSVPFMPADVSNLRVAAQLLWKHRILIAAVALVNVGVWTMVAIALPGIGLGCDLGADPNIAHTLYGVHLARGGHYDNTLYPGVLHFTTYALFVRAFGNTANRFTFSDFENSVYLCRLASLTINIVVYQSACACLYWLCRQHGPSHRRGFPLLVLAGFSVLWMVAFPVQYYSHYLRPDNGLLLGLMPATIAGFTLWRGLASAGNRQIVLSGIWLGAATALFTISKNQGQLFMLSVVVFGFVAALSQRRLRAFWIWSTIGCASHFGFTTCIWLLLRTATNSTQLPWGVICDPTYVMRNHSELATANSGRFLLAGSWALACAAPAVALIVALLACRLASLIRSSARGRNDVPEAVALSGALLLILTLPVFYGLRWLAVYNLVVPVGATVFLAAVILAVCWPRTSLHERRIVGFAALFALPIAFYSNGTLRARAIDHHQVITAARGSLDQTAYIYDNRSFCDLPEMKGSLVNQHEQTHWRLYLNTVSDYWYLKHICADLKQDPEFISAAKGTRDFQDAATKRILVLLGIRSKAHPTVISAASIELAPGKYRLKPDRNAATFIVSAVFNPQRGDGVQTLVSDWTFATIGHSMYLAVRPDGTLRLGDGRDFVKAPQPIRWNQDNRLQIEYTASRRRVFLNDELVAEDSQIPLFDPARPFVIGRQGELEGEFFCGALRVQVQGASIENWNTASNTAFIPPQKMR